MSLILQAEAFFLLLVAAFLSALIGLDRERGEQAAGLRTHILVGIGSCLFTIVSRHAFSDGDPARVASQILPGIGFLTAGAILKQQLHVQGLTTAAGIWVTAAIGMSVGTGAWLLALSTTLIVWVVLVIIRALKRSALETSVGAKTACGKLAPMPTGRPGSESRVSPLRKVSKLSTGSSCQRGELSMIKFYFYDVELRLADYEALQAIASNEGRELVDVVREALEEYVQHRGYSEHFTVERGERGPGAAVGYSEALQRWTNEGGWAPGKQ
jgi:uncharacterized membrane protein YhiD involved in acid resistance